MMSCNFKQKEAVIIKAVFLKDEPIHEFYACELNTSKNFTLAN